MNDEELIQAAREGWAAATDEPMPDEIAQEIVDAVKGDG